MKKKFLLGIGILISCLLIVFVNIIAANHSYGLEGDEVFSYISATSLEGYKGICFLEDQTWYADSYFEDALTATGAERFNLKMVSDNQAMDTHPPLYYMFLNAVCSFFTGQYSRWFGIGLNILFMLGVHFSLCLLMQYFIKNKYLSLIFSTIFCCSFLAISMTLFIRMYVLLMALFILQSWFHLKLYDNTSADDAFSFKAHWKTYLFLLIITLTGALTHYYFLVYQCLIAGIYVLGLWFKKKYKAIGSYIGTMAAAGVAFVAIYPASLTHLFFKYRGREAVHKFLKETSLFGDAGSMLRHFDSQLFKGTLLILLALLVTGTLILVIRKKISRSVIWKGLILLLPSLVYFYGISKASPYIAVRYISPVAAIIYTVIIIWAKYLLDHMLMKDRTKVIGNSLLCVLFFCTTFFFFTSSFKPAYLAERKEIVDDLAKEAEYCVYITGDEYNWKMWEDYVNYPTFKGLFFIDGQARQPITDEKLLQQDNLVIYIDTAMDYDAMQEYLQQYLPLQQYEIKYETSYTYIVEAN